MTKSKLVEEDKEIFNCHLFDEMNLVNAESTDCHRWARMYQLQV
jgi:hypothetical protein